MICRSGAAQESAACGQHETCRAARARQQPRGKPLHRNTCGKIDARQNTIPQNADSRPGDPERLPQRFQASWIRKRLSSRATTHRERPGSLGCRRISLRLATTTGGRGNHRRGLFHLRLATATGGRGNHRCSSFRLRLATATCGRRRQHGCFSFHLGLAATTDRRSNDRFHLGLWLAATTCGRGRQHRSFHFRLRLATTTNHGFRHRLSGLATSASCRRCCRNSRRGRCTRRGGTTGCGCSSSLRAARGRCGTADGLLGYRRLLGGCCHQSLLSREIRLAINVCTDCTPCTTNRGQFLTARS